MIKNFSRIFLDIYIEAKFHALSIYEVFRAIRARQTTLWSLLPYRDEVWFFFVRYSNAASSHLVRIAEILPYSLKWLQGYKRTVTLP